MNNKNWLKLCSLVLALMLCLTSFGTLVFAEGEEEETAGTTAPTLEGLWIDKGDTSWFDNAEAGTTTFYLSTEEQLAGLAKLVSTNGTKGGKYLSGYTFYLTDDMDLSGKNWTFGKGLAGTGNGNDQEFCGTIIGAKGASAQNPYVEGTTPRITISNMASTLGAGTNIGFIAAQGGGGVQNINFDNAYFTGVAGVGIVTGYIKANANAPVYKNITISNSTILASGTNVGGLGGSTGATFTATDCLIEDSVFSSTNNGSKVGVGGYVGQGKHGEFTNCDLENVKLNCAGGCVAGINGYAALSESISYTNCDVDVDITVSNVASWIGGIYGYNSKKTVEVTNCTVSGSITVPKGSATIGGISGSAQIAGNTYTNIVSTMNINILNGEGEQSTAIGGVIGTVTANCTISNCYYGGVINDAAGSKQVGGIAGAIGSAVVTLENCQMDGIVNTNATQDGALIGRWNVDGTLTLDNVIVTGLGADSRSYSWIGLGGNFNKTTGSLTTNNCFSNAKMSFIGWNDWDEDKINDKGETCNDSTVTINGTPVVGTSTTAYASYKPNLMASQLFWMMNENWDTTGATPVLKIAKDIVNPFAGADLSWFDPASATTEYTIADKADALGVAMLGQLTRANTLGYTYTVAQENIGILADAKAQAGVGFGTQNDNIVIKNGEATVMNDTLAVKYQTKGDSIRLIASIGNEEVAAGYEKVGFKLTYGGQTATLVTTTVYQTIVADSDNVNAAAVGYSANSAYLYVVTLEDVPAEAEFIVEAFVVTANGTVTGEAYTFCLNALN